MSAEQHPSRRETPGQKARRLLNRYHPSGLTDPSTWDIYICPVCREPVRVNFQVHPDPTDPLGSIIEGHVEDIHCCDEP